VAAKRIAARIPRPMAEQQVTSGIRRPLGLPLVYTTFVWLNGGWNARRTIIAEYVKLRSGNRLLDIGCGPGAVLDFLPAVQYVGVDLDADYIRVARARHGDRGTFIHGSVESLADHALQGFDVVIAFGLLHHLNDESATQVLRTAGTALKPSGRLVTLDTCYVPGQSWLSRTLTAQDRGQHVRDVGGYGKLAQQGFGSVATFCRSDLVRGPFHHCILVCERPLRREPPA